MIDIIHGLITWGKHALLSDQLTTWMRAWRNCCKTFLPAAMYDS